MSQLPIQQFLIGARVFTRDGRSGLISGAVFAPALGVWRYVLEGISEIFLEADLQDRPFTTSGPGPGAGGNITEAMFLAALATGDVSPNLGTFARFVDAFEDDLEVFFREFPSLVGQFPLRPAVPDQPSLPPSPEVAVPPSVTLDLEAIFREVDRRISIAVGAAVVQQIEARQSLENQIAVRQLEIEERLASLDVIADETGEGGSSGFFRRVGGFLANPFAGVADFIAQHILDEVTDGLTR